MTTARKGRRRHTADAGSNWGKWSDKKADELTQAGLRETTPEKRRQIVYDDDTFMRVWRAR